MMQKKCVEMPSEDNTEKVTGACEETPIGQIRPSSRDQSTNSKRKTASQEKKQRVQASAAQAASDFEDAQSVGEDPNNASAQAAVKKDEPVMSASREDAKSSNR